MFYGFSDNDLTIMSYFLNKLKERTLLQERVAYAEIDWHDFVIVETVDFPVHERSELPPPITKEQLGVRMARITRLEEAGPADEPEPERQPEPQREVAHVPKQPQVVERDLGREVQEIPQAPPKPMAPLESAPPVQREDIVVRSDYNPKNQSRTKVCRPSFNLLLVYQVS